MTTLAKPTRGLIFSQFPLFPANQGNRARLLEACREFTSRGFILDFAYYPREFGGEFSSQDLELHTNFFKLVFLIPSSHPYPQYTADKNLSPASIWDPIIGAYLEPLLRSIDYSFVYVNYSVYAPIFDLCIRGELKILDTHDVLGERRDEVEAMGELPDFFSLAIEDEVRLVMKADLVIAIKSSDAEYFSRITSQPVLTLGVPVVNKQSSDANKINGKLTFGFIGSVNSVNKAALSALYDLLIDWAPSLAGKAEFLVCGRIVDVIPVSPVLTQTGLVRTVSFVEHLENFYEQCDVVIIPTIKSTGLKIKAVEALSFKKAVIATADGFDGIGSTHPEHNCSDITELLGYVMRLAQGEMDVSVLKAISQNVIVNYMEKYSRSVEALVSLCGRMNVLVIPDDKDRMSSLHVYLRSLSWFFARSCNVWIAKSPSAEDWLLRLRQKGVFAQVNEPGSTCQRFDLKITSSDDQDELGRACPVELRFQGLSHRLISRIGQDQTLILTGGRALPLDRDTPSYWGPRVRLTFFIQEVNALPVVSALLNSHPLKHLLASFLSIDVITDEIKPDFKDMRVSTFTPISFVWAKRPPARTLLVSIGARNGKSLPFFVFIASAPCTEYFAMDVPTIQIIKWIVGSDVSVRYSRVAPRMAEMIVSRIQGRVLQRRALSRYRRNRGALDTALENIKEARCRRLTLMSANNLTS